MRSEPSRRLLWGAVHGLAAPLCLGLLLLGPAIPKAAAKEGNPAAEVPPPPPPPPPTNGAEDDSFLDNQANGSNNGFGFQNNNPGANAAAPSYPSAPPPSQRAIPPSNGPTGSVTPTPVTQIQSGKPAPKLADYLELDSSVKGLEVRNFDLPEKDIRDVVLLISKWTGKNFILDSKVRGKITIIGPSQVTLQEAYQAFLSALDANGLTTVQSGKYIRIIESAEARRAPVKTYAGDYAPKDDQFITRIFQLKYINADEVQREFRDLTTRQGKLFAYEPTNSIIITDTGSNIQRIKEIVEVLDVKNFETTMHVMKIKNSSAKAISDMLGNIYGDSKQGAAGAARTFTRSALERTRGGGIISKIIPDEQTNSLVVLANAAGFEQLKQLVGKLDIRVTDTGRIHVYYCEYAKAEDLASTLASLSQGSAGGKKSTTRNTSVSTPNSPTTPVTPIGQTGSSGPVTAELDGGVKVTSDNATNALVITANTSDYQTLKRVIRKLDIPRLQVFVETAILEIALDNTTNIGNNLVLGAPGRGFAGGFVGDSNTLLQVVSGTGIPTGATIPLFAGPAFQATVPGSTTGTTQTITLTSFMGLLNLLTSNTNTSVLSTPQIIALDNEKAVFKVQDEIPVQSSLTFLGAGSSTGSIPGAATGTIDRLKTGIEINLTPHVNASSRSIRLEIEQKVDSTKASSTVPQALQNVQVATTSRVTNTTVVVRDADYIMLGGLMQDQVTDTLSKVPLLGDIPILGWLFKSKNTKSVKTNLVVLMHPRIIGTSLDAADIVNEKLQKRDRFQDKNVGTADHFTDEVGEMKSQVKAQQARGRTERPFDYRNNDESEDVDRERERRLREDEDNPPDDRSGAVQRDPGPRTKLEKPPEDRTAQREANSQNNAQAPLLPPAGAGQTPPPGNIPSDMAARPETKDNAPPDAQLLDTLEGNQ